MRKTTMMMLMLALAMCLSCVDEEQTDECAAPPEIRWTVSGDVVTMPKADFRRWQDWTLTCSR